ncbi:MAG: tetratricopeptide repeat protein [Acidobacteria bacterium]|nr:tetratricopeptide repeat protein [Acidobacteriota bacterium]
MDRLTRHELKSDKFVEEVGQTVHFLEAHKQQAIRYGGIALAVLVLAGAGYWFMKNRAATRQEALYKALETYNAPVLQEAPPEGVKAYKTDAERQAAIQKDLGGLIANYSGSEEAAICTYLLGLNAADHGKIAEAEKYLKTAIDDAGKDYASLARLSLAQLYASQGKVAEADALVRPLISSPTVLVSKDLATLELAKMLAKSKPEEAKKLLEPLRSASGPISRAAIQAYANIPQSR